MKRMLFILLCTACLLSACKPTPDKPIVVNKNDGILNDKLTADTVTGKLEVPENVKCSFDGKTSGVTVEIDAKPSYPKDMEQFPVYELVPEKISLDFIEKAINASLGNAKIFEPPYQRTKSDISKRMKQLETMMTDEYLDSHYNDNIKDKMLSEFQIEYSSLSRAYQTAPEKSNTGVEATVKFYPDSYYKDPEVLKEEIAEAKRFGDTNTLKLLQSKEKNTFRCYAELEDGSLGGIYANNFNDNGILYYSILFQKGNMLDPNSNMMPMSVFRELESFCNITESEAKESANQLLESLGLSDTFGISEVELQDFLGKENWNVYRITYRRKTDKLVAAKLPVNTLADEMYRAAYDEEIFEVILNNDGIVQWSYVSPFKITRTVNDGVEVMSFNDILDHYKQQSALTYDNVISENEEGGVFDKFETAPLATMKVDKIELTLMRIVAKNKQNTYLLQTADKARFFCGLRCVKEPFYLR